MKRNLEKGVRRSDQWCRSRALEREECTAAERTQSVTPGIVWKRNKMRPTASPLGL